MHTALLVTARLKSTRLPLKAIKPIHGRPMIVHMLDRLKLAQSPQHIIICTSTNPQDDPLEEIAHQEGVWCFRGHPDDVLLRLTDAASFYGVDTVVSCTADNPFVDPVYIDRLVAFHCAEGNDYTNILGLPFGVFSYALAHSAMLRACTIKATVDTEVWGGYFTRTGLFKTGKLVVTDPAVRRPDLRLTVDTPHDFELINWIFDTLYVQGQVFPLEDIVRLCDKHPEMTQINAHIVQKVAHPIVLK
jgi:spore coat polysaccharide biosynthesis protein SpsF